MTYSSFFRGGFTIAALGATSVLGCGLSSAPGSETGGSSSGGAGTGGAFATGGSSATGGNGNIGRSCSVGADCSLVSKTCCGSCGEPSADDMTAVTQGAEQAYRDSVCMGDVACPACATLANPRLFAVCESGTCAAVDVAARPETKCAADADCVVKPRACCECGAGSETWNLIALRSDSLSFLNENLCAPNEACDECAWIAPPEVAAACDGGVCVVKDSRPTPF